MKCKKCNSNNIMVVSTSTQKFGSYEKQYVCLKCGETWTKKITFGYDSRKKYE